MEKERKNCEKKEAGQRKRERISVKGGRKRTGIDREGEWLLIITF